MRYTAECQSMLHVLSTYTHRSGVPGKAFAIVRASLQKAASVTAVLTACGKEESDSFRHMGADLGVERLQAFS